MSDPAPSLLRASRETLALVAPAGYKVKGSAGAGNLAQVPWIAFLDPDVTESAQRGIYVVYLWSVDASTLFLCLSQGVTDVEKKHKSNVLTRLRSEADKIRSLVSEECVDLLADIQLGSSDRLPVQYEAATIAAIGYKTNNLPSEEQLRTDLARMASIYGQAVGRKRSRLTEDPEAWEAGLPELQVVERVSEKKLKWNLNFGNDSSKPGGDVFFPIKAGVRRVTRRHVAVLESLRGLLKESGWTTSSPHPFDLEARRPDGRCLLIEVKVIRENDIAGASREAIGQLLDYQFAYREFVGGHTLVAAFSDRIDDHYRELLKSLGISVWWYDPANTKWQAYGQDWS
jgi:hypothetical protein